MRARLQGLRFITDINADPTLTTRAKGTVGRAKDAARNVGVIIGYVIMIGPFRKFWCRLSCPPHSSVSPELGCCSSKQIAALVGVAPFNHDSGKLKGYRRTGGGRKSIRNILYIVAVGMARGYNPRMQKFYKRMRDSGKRAKVALIVVIRKIVVMLNAMMKNDTLWEENDVPV